MSEEYLDLADLFGVYEGSAQTPINTLNKMFGISGNPLFLYLTGVMDANALRSSVQMATWEPVDTSDTDYWVMEEMNVGDPVLTSAYQLIKKGVSVNAAMRSMLDAYNKQYKNDPTMLDSRETYMQYALNDIEEFKRKWDNAQNVESKFNSGEYVQNPDGSVSKRMDPTKAADVLKQMGMPGILQNPFVWEVVPDAQLLGIAAQKDEYAQRILKPFERMIDPATGMLIQKEAQKIAKRSADAGKSAYEMLLSQTKEGKRYLEGKTTTIGGAALTDSTIASRAAANPPNFPTSSEKSAQKPKETPKGVVGNSVLDENPEYWAKLAASYAGRAEQERLMKPVNTARTRALAGAQEAMEYRQGAVRAGTSPAIGIINQAFPFASALSQSGEPQIRFPFLGGVSSSSGGRLGALGPIADQWLYAKKDPRLQGLTPQQIDLFSTIFAQGR